MNIEIITEFFFWCTVINGTILLLMALLFTFMPNFLYKSQKKFFDIERKTFDITFYSILAYMKFTFLIFNLVPYVALIIIEIR